MIETSDVFLTYLVVFIAFFGLAYLMFKRSS